MCADIEDIKSQVTKYLLLSIFLQIVIPLLILLLLLLLILLLLLLLILLLLLSSLPAEWQLSKSRFLNLGHQQ